MTASPEERLEQIERRIAAIEEPHGLMRFIDDNADIAAVPGMTRSTAQRLKELL